MLLRDQSTVLFFGQLTQQQVSAFHRAKELMNPSTRRRSTRSRRRRTFARSDGCRHGIGANACDSRGRAGRGLVATGMKVSGRHPMLSAGDG